MVAIALAYDRNSTILTLVSNAWAGFGAAFGPLVVLSLYWKRMTFAGALAGILTGALTVLFWIYAPVLADGATLSSLVYEILPGAIISTISIVVVSKLTPAPTDDITALFSKMRQQLHQQ